MPQHSPDEFISEEKQNEDLLPETDFFINTTDVIVFRQFQFMEDSIHTHNFFEIFYVFKGRCQLKFENQLCTLSEGQLCIIAPNSSHSVIHDDENSTIITTSIRKSTFDNAFFPLLTHNDLLSNFFRTILYNKTSSNYLLFSTGNSEDIKLIIKNLVMEFNKRDNYSNNGCISWINLLFSLVLRNYSETVEFYNYNFFTDFHIIMQYIKQNYHFLSLSSLASFFNYSETHLSSIIKKNTGLSFIRLITNLKMCEAIKYLENTNTSIEKIAALVGYNSSDHFSRTFKKYYRCSPQKYRNICNQQNSPHSFIVEKKNL